MEELRRLEWDVWPEPFSIDDFIQSMSTDTWPMLEDLGVDNSEASDQELSLIIGKMHRVIGLSVVYCTFKMQSMAALRHHFPWLRRLNISCPANYTDISEFVIEVLKSCPQLESLKADDLRAESLMNDTPWACQRSLRILELRFGIIPAQFGNDSQCEAIIGRLIGLVNLERLDVPASWLNDFQSRCRLEQLSRLTRLRKLIRHGVEAINE
ncbi:hypothetical protein BGX31_008296 [Mortierella sp. GBA43]|nr:hypothetical protein BGX31_008296 [Mortierella sp. GBA43]